MINKRFSLLAQILIYQAAVFSTEATNLLFLVSLCLFTEATAVNCYQMCPDQTGLKFKGDFPIDCMSEHPGVQRHNMSSTPGRDERCVNLWPCAPSLVLTSWCLPLHWLGQANGVSSDQPSCSCLDTDAHTGWRPGIKLPVYCAESHQPKQTPKQMCVNYYFSLHFTRQQLPLSGYSRKLV